MTEKVILNSKQNIKGTLKQYHHLQRYTVMFFVPTKTGYERLAYKRAEENMFIEEKIINSTCF